MSVTKIRKFSSSIMFVLILLSIVVIGLVYFGGSTMTEWGMEYNYTDLLMYFTYGLAALAVVVTLISALGSFFRGFAQNRKRALTGVGMFIGLIALFIVCYTIGDATTLSSINADSQKFNIAGWLKLIDMSLYAIYALVAINIVALVFAAFSKK